MDESDRDDLDDLFAATPPPPAPADLGVRARARLGAIRAARRLTLIAFADLAALVALTVLAYLLGSTVAAGDAPAIVRLIMEDRALAMEERGQLARAFVGSIPWLLIAAVAVDGLALIGISTHLLRATNFDAPDTRRGT